MASRNEYEMLFKLSAQLGQNFNGTFSSAQKTLAATQKEIQSLNKLQSDITSYTKQQQSVDALKNKLSTYEQQLRNVQQEIAASGEYSSSLANKELDLKQKIEQTESSLRQKTETLDRMGDALSEAGVDMGNLSGEAERLGKEVDDLKEKQEKAADEAQRFGDVGSNSAIAVSDALAAAGIAKLLKEIYEAYGECITGAAAFADEIGTVSVQYGISAQDLQAYYYAAELVDVSVETLTSTMARNVRAMSYAQDGTERYAEAYETLGVSVTNADGSLRDSEDVYWDVIDALGGMTNESERDALAMELLGRSAQQINTLIAAGSGVMDEYSQMAEKAGYVMSDKTLASAMALDDELQIQKNNVTALKNTIGTQFAPEATAALKLWNEMLAGMTEFAEENPVVVKSLIAIGLELATIVGIYGGYVAIKKTANALKALSAALTAKETVATGAQTAATVAQTTATGAATTAQTALNAAMMANPIGLIIAAVAALTVGVIAMTSAMAKANDPSTKLTETTRKQKAELEQLNADYKEACEVYGETSEEASRLRYEMDELNAAIEENGQTVEEFVNECDELAASANQVISDYKTTTDEIRQNELSTLALIQKLDDLASQNIKTAATEEQMRSIIEKLNEQMPDLALSYDDVASSAENYVEVMRRLARQKAEDDKQKARMEAYSEALIKQEELTKQIAEAEENLRMSRASDDNAWFLSDAWFFKVTGEGWLGSWATSTDEYLEALQELEAEYDATKKTIADITAEWEEYGKTQEESALSADEAAEQERNLKLALDAVSSGYMTTEQAAKYYNVDLKKLEARVESFENDTELLASALKAVRNGFLTADEAAKAFGITVESLDSYKRIVEITDEITALSEAYQDAYDEAYESISGQYKLWDKAAQVIPEDLEKINIALETQNAYWHDYNVDLQSLKDRSDEIEGLAEVVASFADGSNESVNVIAGMAQASDEELRELVANWQELQSQQDGTAKSLRDMNADYSPKLKSLQEQLQNTIDELNLEEEAKDAAKATMDAYIQALKEGADEASKVAQQLATQIGTSLNSTKASSSGGSGGSGSGSGGGGSNKVSAAVEVPAQSQEELIAAKIIKFVGASGSGMNAGKSGDNGIVAWSGKEYKVQNSGTAYGSSTPIYKAAVEVLGFADRQIFGYNGKIYGYLDGHIQELEGRTLSSKGYNNLASDMKTNYGSYHSGGLVGDVATLSASEEFAKLLKGEFVSTPAQMRHFMEDTLPQIAEYKTTVLPAAEAHSSQGIVYTITIAPQFTMTGVESDTMDEKIRECGDMLVDMVVDKLEEMGIDAKRGAYV